MKLSNVTPAGVYTDSEFWGWGTCLRCVADPFGRTGLIGVLGMLERDLEKGAIWATDRPGFNAVPLQAEGWEFEAVVPAHPAWIPGERVRCVKDVVVGDPVEVYRQRGCSSLVGEEGVIADAINMSWSPDCAAHACFVFDQVHMTLVRVRDGEAPGTREYDEGQFVRDLDAVLAAIVVPEAPEFNITGDIDTALGEVIMHLILRSHRDVLRGAREMLLAKNTAYGDSALNPLRVFSKASTKEQLLVRLDDKISRLQRGSAAGEDVLHDMLGYIILIKIAELREKEGR